MIIRLPAVKCTTVKCLSHNGFNRNKKLTGNPICKIENKNKTNYFKSSLTAEIDRLSAGPGSLSK